MSFRNGQHCIHEIKTQNTCIQYMYTMHKFLSLTKVYIYIYCYYAHFSSLSKGCSDRKY